MSARVTRSSAAAAASNSDTVKDVVADKPFELPLVKDEKPMSSVNEVVEDAKPKEIVAENNDDTVSNESTKLTEGCAVSGDSSLRSKSPLPGASGDSSLRSKSTLSGGSVDSKGSRKIGAADMDKQKISRRAFYFFVHTDENVVATAKQAYATLKEFHTDNEDAQSEKRKSDLLSCLKQSLAHNMYGKLNSEDRAYYENLADDYIGACKQREQDDKNHPRLEDWVKKHIKNK